MTRVEVGAERSDLVGDPQLLPEETMIRRCDGTAPRRTTMSGERLERHVGQDHPLGLHVVEDAQQRRQLVALLRRQQDQTAPAAQRRIDLLKRDIEGQRGELQGRWGAARSASQPLGTDSCHWIRFASARCGITTPLGVPVEPEVNST